MQRNWLYLTGIVFCIASIIPDAGCEAQPALGEEIEILRITVGQPTKLSSKTYQNTSVLLASRTGVVAVIYPKTGGPRFYRTSTDAGLTWSKEVDSPLAFGGGQCSGTLRDGGVIIAAKDPHPSTEYTRAKG